MKKDMEKKMNIRLGFGCAAALLIAMMFASCTKVEMEAPSAKFGGEIRFGITKNDFSKPATKSASESESKVLVAHDPNDPESFGLSMTVVDGIQTPKSNLPATKGAQITDVNAFDVAAYYFAPDQENGLLYFADQVSDGVNTTGKQYYWPMMGTMNFVATYPSYLIANGIQTIADDNGNLQPFSYTIPEDVTAQQDIMVAVTNGIENAPRSQSGAAVGLNFQHLLAAVQFKVGDMQFIQINSLKITGVYGGEISFEHDSSNNTWIPSYNSASIVEYDLSSVISETSGLIQGDEITSNSNSSILLVAPQTLPEGAMLEVDWTEVITGVKPKAPVKVSLAGQIWEAGKTTIYSLAISGTEFTVEIPRPEDQDAHYIMLNMSYDLSDPDIIENVDQIDITARWKTDDNGNDVSGDTGSSDKRDISMKFNNEDDDLSYTQKQGYWTDWQYLKKITIIADESSEEVQTVVEGPTKVSDGNLIGSTTLTLSGSALSTSGNIMLFIDENNGVTDRVGELIFKAMMKSGKSVEIGKGSFKQLCPSWNDENIGVERIEDGNVHPYGFNYSRKVTFSNPGNATSSGFLGIGLFRYLDRRSSESAINNIIGNATNNGFITTTSKTDNVFWLISYSYIDTIELNYNALSNVSGEAGDSDGLANTLALYNFTGGTSVSQIEDDIIKAGWISTSQSGTVPVDYAAYVALSRNRMYELKTEIYQNDGSETKLTNTTFSAVLYKDGTDGLEGNDIIEWFLPSISEAETLVETGVDCDGNESVIDDLNGTYWSSTAGSDADVLAYSYTFANNKYVKSQTGNRGNSNIVRAVRKKPTAN